MDEEKHNDWPLIQTQPALRSEARVREPALVHVRKGTPSPSVT